MILVTKKEYPYTPEIEQHRSRGLVHKRGKLDNLEIMGAIEKNPLEFQLKIRTLLGI